MEKKYKLTDETIEIEGHILHRIEALRDFGYVNLGELGGYVESENNLRHGGNCWIYNDAKVFGCAEVSSDAEVRDNAEVSGNAIVQDSARIFGHSKVYGTAIVCSHAMVYDNAVVHDKALVLGYSRVYGDAVVCGAAVVYGDALIGSNAKVESTPDYIVFKNWWSSGRFFTWTRSDNMWRVGCFCGTGEELIAKAYKDSELSGREYTRIVEYVESILKDNGS